MHNAVRYRLSDHRGDAVSCRRARPLDIVTARRAQHTVTLHSLASKFPEQPVSVTSATDAATKHPLLARPGSPLRSLTLKTLRRLRQSESRSFRVNTW
jgi:hypothetical protein